MKFMTRFTQAQHGHHGPCWVRAIVILVILGWNGAALAQQTSQQAGDNPVFPSYRLGPEDQLKISVWQDATLKEDQLLVRPDGKLSFPLAGEIQAAGMTPGELQTEIAKRLNKYIPDPVVSVLVEKVAGYKVYVIGQVKTPGQYQMGHYIDVMQALALAGGLTPFAAQNKIKILRRNINGVERAIPFEYATVEKGEDLAQNIMLKSGDMVVVP